MSRRHGIFAGLFAITVVLYAGGIDYPPASEISRGDVTVALADWARAPLSSTTPSAYPPPIDYRESLSRVGVMRFEPVDTSIAAGRAFVADLNRTLAILDLATKSFVTYINFEEVFPRFVNRSSLGTGFVTFAFDPAYANTGRLYTVHLESPKKTGPVEPTNVNLPGLDISGGYVTTASIDPPNSIVVRHAVIVEWTDTDLTNTTFEGTAREIMRLGFNFSNHSVGDMLFNPTASPGDPDYGNLYIAAGDGGAGVVAGELQPIPQRLDTLPGKILRITPDVDLRPADALAENGRYRVPTAGADPNPFLPAEVPGARPEIFAYGFRNPQRMSWDHATSTAIVVDIGLASWEEVNILRKGANYGYPEREGSEQLWIGGPNDRKTGSQANPPTAFPDPDTLTVQGLAAPVVPRYPVAVYSHRDGDAIAGGFVYRGARLPELVGQYVFGDITTGRLFYADLSAMLAADDANPASVAPIRELQVAHDSPDRGVVVTRLFDIVAAEYRSRGGTAGGGAVLPGASDHLADGLDRDGIAFGGGRADIRFATGRDGELYLLSKSDGMIRALTASFPQPPSVPDHFIVTVAVQGAGNGIVATSPLGLRCPATCAAGFPAGYTVTLTPQPDALSAFAGWGGACSGTGACSLTTSGSVTATFVASSPDLVAMVTSIPAAIAPGAKIGIGETTTNDGTAAAAATSTTRYYLSPDTLQSGGDVVLGSRSVAALAAGTGSTYAASLTVPLTTALGDYYVIACADDTLRIAESSETNNCGASASRVTVTRPDLVTTAVADPPAHVAPGRSLTAADTVVNRGGYVSGSTSTRYYLSADAVRSAGDVLLTGSRSVPSLSPGASSTGSASVTVPTSTPLGRYLLLACADDTAKVAELIESNNCLASSGSILVGRPDLVTTNVSNPPSEIAPGKSFSVTATTLNQGDAPAGASTLRYYLSADALRDPSDYLLTGTRSVGALAPGTSSAGARSVTVPASVPAGAYRVLACSDDLGVVTEHNETNNCGVAAAAVNVRLPDLVQLSVSNPPSELVAGMSFSVTDSVRNDGAIATGTTSTRYYLSIDAVKNSADILLAGVRSVSLGVGATNTGSKTATAPASLPAGTYYLLACADDTNAAVEAREDNNCVVSAAVTIVR